MTTCSGQAIDLPADSPLRGLAGRPTLVVLLRSFGCTFCREAMTDVAAAKHAIHDAGANIAFVHGASSIEAAPWFAKYGLDDVMTVSDPDRAHYKAFGLGRTSAAALVDPRVWGRGAVSALLHGFGGQTPEMMRQLPGVFVVQRDKILAEYRHRMEGEACFETPTRAAKLQKGETLALPGDTPMRAVVTGSARRHVLAVIVHDAVQPATMRMEEGTDPKLVACK